MLNKDELLLVITLANILAWAVTKSIDLLITGRKEKMIIQVIKDVMEDEDDE